MDEALIRKWAPRYPVGSPLVLDPVKQFEPIIHKHSGEAYGRRIWPRGGRKKGCGNIAVYVKEGALDLNGVLEKRNSLKAMVKDWVRYE